MDKILAIAVLVVFVWLAIPRIIQGQWLSPTVTAPNTWETAYNNGDSVIAGNYNQPELTEADASTPAGYGWYHFDFWNKPPITGEPATKADLQFRSPRNEFKD